MKKIGIIIFLSILIIFVLFAIVLKPYAAVLCIAQNSIHMDSQTQTCYETASKRDLLALMMAYPEYIKGVEKTDGFIYVVMQSGKKIIYDDKQQKSFEQKLANADLQDMMEMVYPLNSIDDLMQGNFDPGRIRAYNFLKEVYGNSKGKAEANLSNVTLGSRCFPFNKNNGAANALANAFRQIARYAKEDTSIYGFVYPVNGTFNYRFIAGTNQLSPHAFGIAVDLKSNSTDYWRWATRQEGQNRLDSYPRELARAFEDNGFIWGGKWAHFDILHFEYRPELIIKSRYYVITSENQPWYFGFPDTGVAANYIKIIDNAFKQAI